MTWEAISKYLHEFNTVSIFFRILLAAIFGALLGIDRARKNRPAGFRTHMLVCIGSALVMITNQYLTEAFGAGDPARLGAQVISGIGFLGAGAIIVTKRNQVMGLTTAAGLWVDACVGLAIGVGFYSGAIIAAFFILFIIIVMNGVDEALQRSSKYLQLYAEFKMPENLSKLLGYIVSNGMTIDEVEMVEARNKEHHMAAMLHLKLPERVEHALIVEQLSKVDGVIFIVQI